MAMRSQTLAKSGFTLIELLVVVAIISILAGLLFSAFATAREQARKTTCASNLRQIGLALSQYTQDADEHFPNTGAGGAPGEGQTAWMYYTNYADDGSTTQFDVTKSCIYPYVKSTQIFVCPDDSAGQTSGDSYAYNSCLTTPSTASLWPGKAISTVSNVAVTMILAEEGSPQSTNDALFNMYNSTWSPTNTGVAGYDSGAYSGRHSSGSNILFVDGHVKWMAYSNLVTVQPATGGVGNVCPN